MQAELQNVNVNAPITRLLPPFLVLFSSIEAQNRLLPASCGKTKI